MSGNFPEPTPNITCPDMRTNIMRNLQKETEPPINKTNTQSPSPNKDNGISSTIFEHKFLILSFAVIVILLIAIIVWLIMREDNSFPFGTKKDSSMSRRRQLPPNMRPHPSSMLPPVPPGHPVSPVPQSVQQQYYAPPPQQYHWGPPAGSGNPPVHQSKKIKKHDDLVHSVDDEEIQKYSSASSIKSNKKHVTFEDQTLGDESAELDLQENDSSDNEESESEEELSVDDLN